MKVILFWLASVGLLSVVTMPLIGLSLDGSVSDWLLLGVFMTALSWGALMLWALMEIRRDRTIALSDRGAFCRAVFHRRHNVGFLPWLYLRNRVHGKDSAAWAHRRAVGSA